MDDCWHTEAMKRAAGLIVAAVFVMASCSGSDSSETELAEPDTELSDFCDSFSVMLDDTAESYVGSNEHIEDLEALLDVAPPEVEADLTVFLDYLLTGAVDSTVDPDSTLTANWPPEVRDATQRAIDFGFTTC